MYDEYGPGVYTYSDGVNCMESFAPDREPIYCDEEGLCDACDPIYNFLEVDAYQDQATNETVEQHGYCCHPKSNNTQCQAIFESGISEYSIFVTGFKPKQYLLTLKLFVTQIVHIFKLVI